MTNYNEIYKFMQNFFMFTYVFYVYVFIQMFYYVTVDSSLVFSSYLYFLSLLISDVVTVLITSENNRSYPQ
jgi:hypothetical protein